MPIRILTTAIAKDNAIIKLHNMQDYIRKPSTKHVGVKYHDTACSVTRSSASSHVSNE